MVHRARQQYSKGAQPAILRGAKREDTEPPWLLAVEIATRGRKVSLAPAPKTSTGVASVFAFSAYMVGPAEQAHGDCLCLGRKEPWAARIGAAGDATSALQPSPEAVVALPTAPTLTRRGRSEDWRR